MNTHTRRGAISVSINVADVIVLEPKAFTLATGVS